MCEIAFPRIRGNHLLVFVGVSQMQIAGAFPTYCWWYMNAVVRRTIEDFDGAEAQVVQTRDGVLHHAHGVGVLVRHDQIAVVVAIQIGDRDGVRVRTAGQEGDASATLSIGISFESNAHLAALYGIKVLRGKAKVGDLKVGVVSPPDIAINFRKVRKIGLKMPFSFVEGANFIYDYDGQSVRAGGKRTTN